MVKVVVMMVGETVVLVNKRETTPQRLYPTICRVIRYASEGELAMVRKSFNALTWRRCRRYQRRCRFMPPPSFGCLSSPVT